MAPCHLCVSTPAPMCPHAGTLPVLVVLVAAAVVWGTAMRAGGGWCSLSHLRCVCHSPTAALAVGVGLVVLLLAIALLLRRNNVSRLGVFRLPEGEHPGASRQRQYANAPSPSGN